MSERKVIAVRGASFSRVLWGLVGVSIAVGPPPAFGQCNEDQKLPAADAAAGDQFGVSVAVDGDTALIGAASDDDACPANPESDSGSAYVYRYQPELLPDDPWVQEQKLTASDAAFGDIFGWPVSVSGDTAVVAARGDDCPDLSLNCGSVYVFRYDPPKTICGDWWCEEQKLTPSGAPANNEFGFSVGVDDNVIVVGSPFVDDFDLNSGAAYVFRYDGSEWLLEQKLTASDAGFNDQFGYSVALSGDTAVVGAYLDDCQAGPDCGSAYVYRYHPELLPEGPWVQEQKLIASDAGPVDGFGLSVSVSGDTAVVGAFGDDCGPPGGAGDRVRVGVRVPISSGASLGRSLGAGAKADGLGWRRG